MGEGEGVHSFRVASTVMLVSQPAPASAAAGSAASGSAAGSTLPQGPGSEITVVGGPNVTVGLPGPQSDAVDLFGIVPVFIAIGAAIVGARWLFGRTGGRPPDGASRVAESGPKPTEREGPP